MPDPGVDEYLRQAEQRERRWAAARWVAGIASCLAIICSSAYFMLNRVEVGDDRALEAIRASGLRDPKLGGAVTAACDEGESSRRFTASNASNERVEGTVCCGVTGAGKGCTIRWGR
jgi:hypothetical protein